MHELDTVTSPNLTLPAPAARWPSLRHRWPRRAAASPALAQQERPQRPCEIARAEVRELAPSVHATGIVRSRAAADLAAAVGGRLQWVAEPGTAVTAGRGRGAARHARTVARAGRAGGARQARARSTCRRSSASSTRLRASGNAVPRFNVDQAQSNRDIAEADLQVARALLAQTNDQLARSRLTAPFAGVVSDRVHRAGEEVATRRSDRTHRQSRRTRDPDVRAAATRAGRAARTRGRRRRATAANSRPRSARSCRPATRARSRSRC